MGSLKTKQLLYRTSRQLEKERSTFSRIEIVKKMNEIKYLSTQKKVPRLSLRKEIIHLEKELEKATELEKKVIQVKKHETKRVTALKKQITNLKKKLEACQDKNLDKKVQKLSHLLGDFLAKHGTKEDIELSKKILKELKIKDKKLKSQLGIMEKKNKPKHPVVKKRVGSKVANLTEEEKVRVKVLQKRLDSLKQELLQVEPLDVKQIKLIEQKANLIENKLKDYYKLHPELLAEHVEEKKSEVVKSPINAPEIVKHTMKFGEKYEETSEPIGDELPLPPPPKITE